MNSFSARSGSGETGEGSLMRAPSAEEESMAHMVMQRPGPWFSGPVSRAICNGNGTAVV